MQELFYVLEGLDCPVCAEKIKTALQAQEGIIDAEISLPEANLHLLVDGEKEWQEIVTQIVERYEDGVVVTKNPLMSAEEIENLYIPSGQQPAKKSQSKFTVVIDNVREYWQKYWLIIIFIIWLKPKNVENLHVAEILLLLPLIPKIWRGIKNKIYFDELTLMVIASIGAMALGEMSEAVAVLLLYEIGERIQVSAVKRAGKNLKMVKDLRPNLTRVVNEDGVEELLPTENVQIKSIIKVNVGEIIPLDAINLNGNSVIDKQALTGESLPCTVERGEVLPAGSIVLQKPLQLKTVSAEKDSALAKLIALTEKSSFNKAPTERVISKFAKIYTPIAVTIAALLAILPPLLNLGEFSYWLHQALLVLVLSCPCSIVISIPLIYVAGIGRAAKAGILIKGGKYIDALNDVTKILFDKTGTLTTGKFILRKITLQEELQIGEKQPLSIEDVLTVGRILEQHSSHPLALAIVAAAEAKNISLPKQANTIRVIEDIGIGVKGKWEGVEWQLGSPKQLTITELPVSNKSKTCLVLLRDGLVVATLEFDDEVRAEAEAVIGDLRSKAYDMAIISGDHRGAVAKVARILDIRTWFAELLPTDKIDILKAEINATKKILYLGDGVNDAPSLAMANVGIAMGAEATDAATSTADIVFMRPDLRNLSFSFDLAKETYKKVKMNITMSLAVKIIIFILGFFIDLPLAAAILGDVGVALLAIANAVRYKTKIPANE